MHIVFTTPKWRLIRCWVAQGGVCAGCERPMPMIGKHVSDPRWQPNEDHVTPRARGGKDDSTNVVAMHAYCNSKKGDKPAAPHVYRYLDMCQVDSRIVDAAAFAIAMKLHNNDPEAARVPRNLQYVG